MLLGWRFPSFVARVAFWLLYRLRVVGEVEIPAEGPLIYVANHQSHLDPPAVGSLACLRPCYFVARASLFAFRPFGAMIAFFGSIPLERDRGGVAGLRSAVRVLERGGCLLLFPEGTRSPDGSLGRFKPGVVLLARKTGASVLPIALDGLHEIWPRGRRLPRLHGRARVMFGKAIGAEELLADGTEAALERLRTEVSALRAALRGEPAAAASGADADRASEFTPSESARSRPPEG
jgi:1-acyl-sn-glycerol-3-phosphate acyltransferase